MAVIGAALIKHRDHVRVRQASGRTGLPGEALDERGVLRQVRVQDLDGDGALQSLIDSAIHTAGAAARQARSDGVPAFQDRAGQMIIHGLVHEPHSRGADWTAAG